ncbi:metalloendopeptidase-like membrane protein [Rivularia sp. PCC 7116]|uniref:M23 family metallopeptidase n=1 Tax=Rivularia sp. PCC 7116 TaxID=373994 RepID=UPI00029EF617|nr:M23 family metallopeptidase [Rivularia sp. PCC 7116]AFY55659.1 metalloendopeptidase-like membrane protein [Rivularia sp. PCC 7116]
MSNQRLRISLSVALFLIGLLVVCLIALFPGIEIVAAQTVNRNVVATAGNDAWANASFPVEKFQGYTSGFGYRRSPRNRRRVQFHNGLDIAAPKGSYVRNWFAGKVIKVGDRGACGTHIIIKSGSWKHSYCHLQGRVARINGRLYMIDRAGGIKIAKNQQVPSGMRIGRIGMTGRTTGPHLHWVIRYNNRYVDPGAVLRQMYAKQSN